MLPKTGTTTLVLMRERASVTEPDQPPETRRWLEAVRRRLVSRMPLGTRLLVVAPNYVEFYVEATLLAEAGLDPSQVKQEVYKTLRKKLALVDSPDGDPARRPGIPVTNRDVAAWIRGTAGVCRIGEVRLLDSTRHTKDKIAVPRNGLPKWNETGSSVTVVRSGAGG